MAQIDPDEKFMFGFALIPEIGPARFAKLKSLFGTFEEAWKAPASGLAKAKINEKTSLVIATKRSAIKLDAEYERFKQSSMMLVDKNHPDYPELLKQIKSAPYVLFCLGDTSLLGKKQLAIVGTRNPTKYGTIVGEKLATEISNAGLVVTSGMANGIDSIAHRSATNAGKPTIAVLGEGIEKKLQANISKRLADQIIANGGLIISEYGPHAIASKFTFPARNRIISGLSLGVLVVEAGEKSGSLITAHCALEQNREVFAVPGSIFSPQSVGTHLLLKQGAQLTASAKDILEAFQFATVQENNSSMRTFENKQHQMVYDHLSFDPIHIDKLALECKLDSSCIAATLSMLEIQGAAKNMGGGMFIRN